MRSLLSRIEARLLLGAVLIVVTAACEGGSPAPAAAKPPRRTSRAALAMTSDGTCAASGAHAKHAVFQCATCHPCGGAFAFDPPYVFPGGTTTQGGTIVPGTAGTPATCTVACHYPLGAPAKSITWDTPGPLACVDCHAVGALPATHQSFTDTSREFCQQCHVAGSHMSGTATVDAHPESWMDQTSAGFHASSANAGLSGCQSCHGETLAGGAAGVSCGQCHDQSLPPAVASWDVNCTMCHGDPAVPGGAPPRATWGHADDPIRVGAHAAHLSPSDLAPTITCAVCHVVPTSAFSTGHIDGGTAEVTFSGIAAADAPTWNRAYPTCAVYCHGATLDAGGTNHAPSWIGGPSEGACGTCHGLPPPSPHPQATACGGCHPDTVSPDTGLIIPPTQGGKHLDGTLEATGGHDETWMDETSGTFHAFSANKDLVGCTPCHGSALEGGGGIPGCASCHDGTRAAQWGTCVMCHGGVDNPSGAPPKAIWGNRAVAGPSNVGIGVHSTHLAGTATSPPLGCQVCHVKPADVLAPGHADGPTATVTFGSFAASGTAAWDRTAATCTSTYCHARGGQYPTPVWTRTGLVYGCDACHLTPPADTEHRNYHWGLPCSTCHPGASWSTVQPATHVNGVKNVVNPALGGPWTAGWSDCGPCHSY